MNFRFTREKKNTAAEPFKGEKVHLKIGEREKNEKQAIEGRREKTIPKRN